jgi:hypothetical protein
MTHRTVATLFLVTAGVGVGIILYRVARPFIGEPSLSPEERAHQQQVHTLVDQHTRWAQSELAARLETYLARVDQYFEEAKDRIPQFTSEACDPWKYIFSSRSEFELHVLRQFERHVFSVKEVEQLVLQTASAYLEEIRSVENEMLVRIQADVEQLGLDPSVIQEIHLDLQPQIVRLSKEVLPDIVAGAQRQVRRLIVSCVAAEVAAWMASKLAVRAGLVGAGATAGWFTFGVSILAGVVVDAVISDTIQQKVTQEVYAHLAPEIDALKQQAIDGPHGLRSVLLAQASNHIKRYHQALPKALLAAR